MIGPTPWLPSPMHRVFNAPMPAARLYVWRVGLGSLLFADIVLLYLADWSALFGVDGYTTPAVSDRYVQHHPGLWSLLRWLPSGPAWLAIFIVWAISAIGIMAGIRVRLCACLAWMISASVVVANPYMHCGGDRLRTIQLFLLLLSPIPSRSDARTGQSTSSWPMLFLYTQLAFMYFFAGIYKLRHPGWQDGSAMYYVLTNSAWCLAPNAFANSILWDYRFFHLASWGTIIWEMAFPLVVYIRWTRFRIGLGLGIIFHVLCAIVLQVSTFPWYSLSCYLPLLPWERWLSPPPHASSTSTIARS
jgi:hypothetical protein